MAYMRYDLLKGSDSPEEDQKILFKAQIVFWLLGATDGHARISASGCRQAGGFVSRLSTTLCPRDRAWTPSRSNRFQTAQSAG
jgi:hypothetical protein